MNLARADVAIERVQRLEGDVRKELSQLQRRLRDLSIGATTGRRLDKLPKPSFC